MARIEFGFTGFKFHTGPELLFAADPPATGATQASQPSQPASTEESNAESKPSLDSVAHTLQEAYQQIKADIIAIQVLESEKK